MKKSNLFGLNSQLLAAVEWCRGLALRFNTIY